MTVVARRATISAIIFIKKKIKNKCFSHRESAVDKDLTMGRAISRFYPSASNRIVTLQCIIHLEPIYKRSPADTSATTEPSRWGYRLIEIVLILRLGNLWFSTIGSVIFTLSNPVGKESYDCIRRAYLSVISLESRIYSFSLSHGLPRESYRARSDRRSVSSRCARMSLSDGLVCMRYSDKSRTWDCITGDMHDGIRILDRSPPLSSVRRDVA